MTGFKVVPLAAWVIFVVALSYSSTNVFAASPEVVPTPALVGGVLGSEQIADSHAAKKDGDETGKSVMGKAVDTVKENKGKSVGVAVCAASVAGGPAVVFGCGVVLPLGIVSDWIF